MYISVYDLALFILFLLIVVVSTYLIAVLHRAFCVLGHVREVLDAHKEDIHETLSVLPETLVTVNELAVSLKEASDETSHAFRSLQNDLTVTADDLRDRLETWVVYAKVIGQIFRSVLSRSA